MTKLKKMKKKSLLKMNNLIIINDKIIIKNCLYRNTGIICIDI